MSMNLFKKLLIPEIEVQLDQSYSDPSEAAEYVVQHFTAQGRICRIVNNQGSIRIPAFKFRPIRLELDDLYYSLILSEKKAVLLRYFGMVWD